jgi:hypothetical protein
MKISLKFLVISFVACFLSLRADFADDQVKKFLDRYSCSQEIEDQIAEMRLRRGDSKIYFKGNHVARMINAIRLKRFIADNELDKIGIAEKCWSKKIEQVVSIAVPNVNTDRLVSLSEVQQLVKVIEDAGFWDWHRSNVFRDTQGKHVFIDTEDVSFFVRKGVALDVSYVLNNFKKRYIDTLNLEPEAYEWLQKRILAEKDSGKKVNVLANSTKYDDHDINFEIVKERIDPFNPLGQF